MSNKSRGIGKIPLQLDKDDWILQTIILFSYIQIRGYNLIEAIIVVLEFNWQHLAFKNQMKIALSRDYIVIYA